MRSGIVAVWDQDREYAVKLSEYLRREGSLSSLVVLYSDPEMLRQAVITHQVSMALVGRPASDSPWLQETAVLVLAEERDRMPTSVYKYQPAREVIRIISEFREKHAAEMSCGPAAQIRAVYSPLGGCLKTSFGLVMGCLLAEEKNCLFLSLEACSGFRTLFDRQYPADLSDLYAAARRGEDLRMRLSEALQTLGRLKYIPPVIWPEDVREAEQEELKKVLRFLAQEGGFDEIILDVGNDLARPEAILTCCDRIYRLEKEDAFSRAKLAEYDSYLKVGGHEALLPRIYGIPLSRLSDGVSPADWNQWQRWERMIPAVRKILKEESGHA